MRLNRKLILLVPIIFLLENRVFGQPYPQSPIINKIEWDEKVYELTNGSGDNWPITWVNDTLQITSYGDGDGFDEEYPDLTLGFSHIIGDPPHHRGIDVQSNIDTPEGEGPKGIKTSGIIMVDDVLYIYIRNYKPDHSDDFTNSRLAWSTDFGKTFEWVDWYFSDSFGCPDFIQFGPNYYGALDDYVYIVSQDNDNAYKYSPDIVLARVLKNRVGNRNAYEFFAGYVSSKIAIWSTDIERRKAIFSDPKGTQRVSVSYNSAINRFILTTSHQPENDNRTHTGALGIFESEFPWGDWKTIYYDDHWSNNCRTYHHKFPTKWMSKDGKEMWLLFSGLDCGYYYFCLMKAKLIMD